MGTFVDVWLRRGSDVTSNSGIQHPSPPRLQVQRGLHTPETGSGRWGSDGTDSAVEDIKSPEARETEARELGGQPEVGTMGDKGGRQQAGATWINWRISGVKEAFL